MLFVPTCSKSTYVVYFVKILHSDQSQDVYGNDNDISNSAFSLSHVYCRLLLAPSTSLMTLQTARFGQPFGHLDCENSGGMQISNPYQAITATDAA